MSKDQEREAFEHYFSDGGKSPRSVERGADGKYLLGSAHNAWRVWQASRAAMAPAGEPVACARGELVVAIHSLASDFENALGAFGSDAEARRKAEGDIAHARSVAARHNQNGPGCPSPATDRAEVLRLADEMARKAWASASSFDRRMQDEARKYEEDEKASRAALVRLLGVE